MGRTAIVQLVVAGALVLGMVSQGALWWRWRAAGAEGAGGGTAAPPTSTGSPVAAGPRYPPVTHAPAPSSSACRGWDCVQPKQPSGEVTELSRGDPVAAGGAPSPSMQRHPPVNPAQAPSPPPDPPHHCDEDGSGRSPMTHTGVDYFCCNRAVGSAELGAVSSASMGSYIATGGRFPILIVTHDRPEMLNATLSSLLSVRCVTPGDIIVVQDGTAPAVKAVIDRYQVKLHQKDERGVVDPAGRIAQHFRYALNYLFTSGAPTAPGVIIVEDDFQFSPDFYEYFHAVAPALEADPSLWLASAWNDNGFDYLVADPFALRRTRFFPGLGWLCPRAVWFDEFAAAWPESHWDHWLRDPLRHRGRDIVIPEVPRDYHAGIKGTFMDTATHNRYFGSIAMQGDPKFTWDTQEGAAAIQALLQPQYDQRYRRIVKDPETRHLTSVAEIVSFNVGTGVVWYDCAINVQNHDPMRAVAAFFGIWHEGGRGSRDGVHEIWWFGTAKLILINACDPATAGGNAPYVTGSIACSSLRQFMPAGVTPLPSTAFNVPRPLLPRHQGLFGAVLRSPLAHLNNGADANGPPDSGTSDSRAGAATDATLPHHLRGGSSGGDSGQDHHNHRYFLQDLHLPAAVKAAPGAVMVLPPSVKIVASKTAGASCTEVCQRQSPGSVCITAYLPAINDCATLRANFDCRTCGDSMGSDQPAMIAGSAPVDKQPGKCLVNGDPRLFDCGGKWAHALRLCPCDVEA